MFAAGVDSKPGQASVCPGLSSFAAFRQACRAMAMRKKERAMGGWIVALIVGGVAGWIASRVMNRDAAMGVFWNVVVGCVGSVVGNMVVGPLLGVGGSVKQFSLTGLVIAVLGAVILLGVVNLIQRGKVR
jgi:uncharacterized membrane protein YeaQ/YmgE (transglycosylase-associated protein family)